MHIYVTRSRVHTLDGPVQLITWLSRCPDPGLLSGTAPEIKESRTRDRPRSTPDGDRFGTSSAGSDIERCSRHGDLVDPSRLWTTTGSRLSEDAHRPVHPTLPKAMLSRHGSKTPRHSADTTESVAEIIPLHRRPPAREGTAGPSTSCAKLTQRSARVVRRAVAFSATEDGSNALIKKAKGGPNRPGTPWGLDVG